MLVTVNGKPQRRQPLENSKTPRRSWHNSSAVSLSLRANSSRTWVQSSSVRNRNWNCLALLTLIEKNQRLGCETSFSGWPWSLLLVPPRLGIQVLRRILQHHTKRDPSKRWVSAGFGLAQKVIQMLNHQVIDVVVHDQNLHHLHTSGKHNLRLQQTPP